MIHILIHIEISLWTPWVNSLCSSITNLEEHRFTNPETNYVIWFGQLAWHTMLPPWQHPYIRLVVWFSFILLIQRTRILSKGKKKTSQIRPSFNSNFSNPSRIGRVTPVTKQSGVAVVQHSRRKAYRFYPLWNRGSREGL